MVLLLKCTMKHAIICYIIKHGKEGVTIESIYNICIAIGLIIPCICLVIDFIGNAFEFSDFDLDLHMGAGDIEISILPTSFMSLCALILVFGGAGRLLMNRLSTPLCIVISLVFGYIAAFIIQNMIKKLKSIKHEACHNEEILTLVGTVVNTILPNQLGTVSFDVKAGKITYVAKTDPDLCIKQGSRVVPLRFEDKILLVLPFEDE